MHASIIFLSSAFMLNGLAAGQVFESNYMEYDLGSFTIEADAGGPANSVTFTLAWPIEINRVPTTMSFFGVASGISGTSTRASDTTLTIEGETESVSVGGNPPSGTEWDFQGEGSTEDGPHSHHDIHPMVINLEPKQSVIDGTAVYLYTATFTHGWHSDAASPITWDDAKIRLYYFEPMPAVEITYGPMAFTVEADATGPLNEVTFNLIWVQPDWMPVDLAPAGLSFSGYASGIAGTFTWASDTKLTVAGANDTIAIGGASSPGDFWDFQGDGSSGDGVYTHGPHPIIGLEPRNDLVDVGEFVPVYHYTLTFTHNWHSNDAMPITWEDVTLVIHFASCSFLEIHVPLHFPSIQQAIDCAADGSTIVVAPGVYNEAINFNGKAIHLRSTDGPEETIIDAGGLETSVITCDTDEGADTIIEGFTITGGTGTTPPPPSFPSTRGGGIYISQASPTINDCIIIGNTADRGGGIGIFASTVGSSSAPTVTNCLFIGNSATGEGGGLSTTHTGSKPIITDCHFVGNTANRGGGMYNVGGSPTVIDCVFDSNATGSGGGGMYSSSSNSQPIVVDSVFKSNSGNFGGGVYNQTGSHMTLTNCEFRFNSSLFQGGAIRNGDHLVQAVLDVADTLFCENEPEDIDGKWNDLGGNSFFDVCSTSQPQTPPDPVVVGQECELLTIGWPDGVEPPEGVIWYWQATECGQSTGHGSSPTFDVIQSGTYYLRAKNANSDLWSESCGSVTVEFAPCKVSVPSELVTTIQEAIDIVVDGGAVNVGPGTYNEALDFGEKSVQLISTAGPEATIIDGTGVDASVITIAGGQGEETVIDGFTITGGTGTLIEIQGNLVYAGGGMYIHDSNPVIMNCIFIDNVLAGGGEYTRRGGGMFNHFSSPTIDNCLFESNDGVAGGAIYNHHSHPVVNNCGFESNFAFTGAGMFNLASSPQVIQCWFVAHERTAIDNASSSSPQVTECWFEVNTSRCGGAAISTAGGSVTIANCTFVNNAQVPGCSGPFLGGGAFRNFGGSHEVTDSVFIGNTAVNNGGAILNRSGSVTIAGCLFDSNSADGDGGAIHNEEGGEVVLIDNEFINNTSGNSPGSGGAVAVVEASIAVIAQNNFTGNVAQVDGGAIFIDEDSNAHVTHSTFKDNAPNHIAGPWVDEGGNHFIIPGDLTGDGTVGVPDLLILLSAWGPCDDCEDCSADLTESCTVGVADLLILLANWG